MKNFEVSLDNYSGTNIMKGFQETAFSKMESTVKDTFAKGLIDLETFEKAMDELDILKGKKKPDMKKEDDKDADKKGDDKDVDDKDKKDDKKEDDKGEDL